MHLILKAKLFTYSLGGGREGVIVFHILGGREPFLQIVGNFFGEDGNLLIIDSVCKYQYLALWLKL